MIDALTPDLETVTPTEAIVELSIEQRQQRVEALIKQSRDIVDLAIDTHLGDKHTLTGKVVLFSGGNDSTILAHLMRHLGLADYAGHANTTIGIEATRQFVRDTCKQWGLPLLEKYPPTDFRELVIAHGFPGPGHHYKMYQRLKERCLRQIRRDLVPDPRRGRVLFIAGRRRAESARRSSFRASGTHAVPLHEREGSVIWASPLAMWTREDMVMYRGMMARTDDPVPFNSVTDALGMSGECLCGSFAAAGWEQPHCTWGHMAKGKSVKTGRLCGSCEFREAEQGEEVDG